MTNCQPVTIEYLVEILRQARVYVACCCESDQTDPASKVLRQIDEVLFPKL